MNSPGHRYFIISIASLLLLFGSVCAENPKSVLLKIGKARVVAEVADTPALHEKGLMNRKKLPANHGMLFVFTDENTHWFWMKDTSIPLDIAFIDASGVIFSVKTMKPFDLHPISSEKPCRYALEVQADFFKKHKILPGEKVHGLERI